MTRVTPPSTESHVAASHCVSHPSGEAVRVVRDGTHLVVSRTTPQAEPGRWQLTREGDTLALSWLGPPATDPCTNGLQAALEAAFTFEPQCRTATLPAPLAAAAGLVHQGLAAPGPQGRHTVHREMFFQQPALWLPGARAPLPLQYMLSGACRHPRRAPKRSGTLYQRHIPWLGKTFSFRSLDMARDLERFNRWMNDPDVAQVWQETGDLERHRRYLEAIAVDPHMQSMIACLDGEPFGYFESYWAKENRIGPFYCADDYDRGWHVLIGEPAFRGKAYATTWLTSISHYLFLDDPRTRCVVGEPRADHRQQVRNLDRSGYAKVKEFDFPHKRALLVMLLRERYFTDTLWWPRDDEPPRPDEHSLARISGRGPG